MSIHEDWNENQSRKPGMSTTAKVLIILGVCGGICVLLCCGGVMFFGFKVQQLFSNAVTTDATAIRQQTQEIIDIDVPAGLEPLQGFNFFVMRGVVYGDRTNDARALTVFEFDSTAVGGTKGQRGEMLKAMRQQQAASGVQSDVDTDIEAETRETRHFMMRGEKTPFEFIKGKSNSGKAVREVMGAIITKRGAGMFVLMLPEEEYDEQRILGVLASMGATPAPEDDAAGEEDAGEDEDMDTAPAEGNSEGTNKPEEAPAETTDPPADN